MQQVYKRLKSIQDWLFTGSCELCAARIPAKLTLCTECEDSLIKPGPGCPCCAAALDQTVEDIRCGWCQQNTPGFSSTLAAFRYTEPVDRLIQNLKYNNKLYLARTLGLYLAQAVIRQALPRVDAIVPVPLHPKRLRQRGYNQSLEIARPIAGKLGLRLAPNLMQRTRETEPQTNLAHKKRARNVQRAFAATTAVDGLNIAVIDDVMTTGYTADAVSKALIKSGARDVQIWVVART